jgi:hypothetical protein
MIHACVTLRTLFIQHSSNYTGGNHAVSNSSRWLSTQKPPDTPTHQLPTVNIFAGCFLASRRRREAHILAYNNCNRCPLLRGNPLCQNRGVLATNEPRARVGVLSFLLPKASVLWRGGGARARTLRRGTSTVAVPRRSCTRVSDQARRDVEYGCEIQGQGSDSLESFGFVEFVGLMVLIHIILFVPLKADQARIRFRETR